MKTIYLITALVALSLVGCANKKSATSLGIKAGAAGIGAYIGDQAIESEYGGALGAVVGGAVGAIATTGMDGEIAREEGLIEGYSAGAADQTKRLYWMKQNLERGGRETVEIHAVDLPERYTADGRLIVGERIEVPVVR